LVSQETCIVSMRALAQWFPIFVGRLTPHGGISASPDPRDVRFDARTLALRNIKGHKIICLSTSIVAKSFLRERNGRNVINHWQCIYTFGEQRLTVAAIITLVHKWHSSSLRGTSKNVFLVLSKPITAIRWGLRRIDACYEVIIGERFPSNLEQHLD
jgi:hypothetical protein